MSLMISRVLLCLNTKACWRSQIVTDVIKLCHKRGIVYPAKEKVLKNVGEYLDFVPSATGAFAAICALLVFDTRTVAKTTTKGGTTICMPKFKFQEDPIFLLVLQACSKFHRRESFLDTQDNDRVGRPGADAKAAWVTDSSIYDTTTLAATGNLLASIRVECKSHLVSFSTSTEAEVLSQRN